MPLVIAALLLGAAASPPVADAKSPTSSRPRLTAPALGDDDAKPQLFRGSDKREERKPGAAALPQARAAAAEDEEEEGRAQSNSRILVTARRLDVARTRIDLGLGASVYSLTNDAIENRPGGETGNLSDILVQTPGATLSGARLNIRGSPANRVRINNVIVPEPVSDPADLLSSRVADTTRLISGALPAQFGFAPAGVISITTKNGLYQHGGQMELFAGSDGSIEPAFEWAGSIGPTSLFASGELEQDRSNVADAEGKISRDRRTGIDGLGFADHVVDENNRVSFIVGGAHERHEIGATSAKGVTQKSKDGYGVATYQHSEGGFTLQASVFGAVGSDEARFTEPTHERRSSWGMQVDGSSALGAKDMLRFGLLVTRAAARGRDVEGEASTAARTSVAFYLQDEWKLGSSLTINPGVRIEWLRGFGSAAKAEPRMSAVWQSPNGLTAHVGYSRSASAPPLAEPMSDSSLADERDDYFDGGVQQKLGALTLGMDAYWRATRNYIAEHQTIGSAIPTAFEFRRARMKGVELSGTYARHGMAVWANLSISSAEGRTITAGANLFDPQSLAAAWDRYVPIASDRPVILSGGVTERLGELSVGGDVLASSGAVRTLSLTIPNGARHSAYALFGLAAVYHARIAGEAADVRLDLMNLTNVHYVTSDASELEGGWTRSGRGRAITIGIEQGF